MRWQRIVKIAVVLLAIGLFIVALRLAVAERSVETGSVNVSPVHLSSTDQRTLEYCNNDVRRGGEGRGLPAGWKVVSVALVLRHGDRSAMVMNENLKEGLFCDLGRSFQPFVKLFVNRTFLDTTYKEVQERVRRNSQHSLSISATDFSLKKRCGTAELTERGLLQWLRIGAFLKKAYPTLINCGFPFGAISAESTLYSRTWRSLLAFLFGFWPCKRSQFSLDRVDLSTTPNIRFCTSTESLPSGCLCPKLRQSASLDSNLTLAYTSKHGQEIGRYARDINSVLGSSQSLSNNTIWGTLDTAAVHYCHGLPFPNGAHLNDQQRNVVMTKIWKHYDGLMLFKQNNQNHQLLSKLFVYSLLDRIVSMFERQPTTSTTASQKPPVQLQVFSGHDSTLNPLLFGLGLHDGRWVPYASRLVFELVSDSRRAYFVRLFYNGRDLTKLFCHGEEMCSLAAFSKYVKDLGPFSSYLDACR